MGFINVLEPGEWPHYKSDTIQIPSEHGPTALRPKEKSPRQQGNRLGACSLEGHKCGSALELGSAGTSHGCQIFYVPLHEVTTLVSPFISPKTKIQNRPQRLTCDMSVTSKSRYNLGINWSVNATWTKRNSEK